MKMNINLQDLQEVIILNLTMVSLPLLKMLIREAFMNKSGKRVALMMKT